MNSNRLLVTLVTLFVVSVAVVWARSAKTTIMESEVGRYQLRSVVGKEHTYMYKIDTVSGATFVSEDGGMFISR